MTQRSDRAERAAEKAADKAEIAAKAAEGRAEEKIAPEFVPSPPHDPANEKLFAMIDKQTHEVSNLHWSNPEKWTSPPTHTAVDTTGRPMPKIGDRLDKDGNRRQT